MKIKEFFNNTSDKKSFRLGGYSALMSVIAIAAAVFVIMAADTLSSRYTKLDMTKKAFYSLSDESKKAAAAVDKKVDIFLIAQSGTEDNFLKSIIEKYSGENKNIHYEIIDPVVSPNFAANYTKEKISNNSVIVASGEKSRYLDNSVLYPSKTDYTTYTETREFDGEGRITAAIRFVSSDILPRMYLTSGHGEAELSENTSSAVRRQNIEIKSLELLTLSEIPSDAECVMINDPQKDISESEKALLAAYLERGGHLILITGYNGVDMPVLNGLMEGFEVGRDNSLILEGDEKHSVGGYNYYLVPEMLGSSITDPLIEAKYSVLLPLAHPITLLNDPDNDALVVDFLKTSDKAYTKVNAIGLSSFERSPEDKTGRFCTGAMITKKYDNGKEAKIFWISSAQLLNDNVNELVAGANRDLFLNIINSAAGREEDMAIHAKSLEADFLTVPSGAARAWNIVLVFLLPLLIIAAGAYVVYGRKKK